jgi:hypothetical protein
VRDLLTTVLDAVGLLLVAAGLGALAYRWIGWTALAVGGVVVLIGSGFSHWQARPPKRVDPGAQVRI